VTVELDHLFVCTTVEAPEADLLVAFGPFYLGEDHLAEFEFDHADQGRSADFRPALPLLFHW
jgi:hypothetical protein